jgi:hypothetical protein
MGRDVYSLEQAGWKGSGDIILAQTRVAEWSHRSRAYLWSFRRQTRLVMVGVGDWGRDQG